jgi:hypothetical protein
LQRGLSGLNHNVNELPMPPTILEPHDARVFGKQRVITADAYVIARLVYSAALTDQDGSSRYELPGKALDSQALRLAVSPVPGTPDSLFMCHDALELLKTYRLRPPR